MSVPATLTFSWEDSLSTFCSWGVELSQNKASRMAEDSSRVELKDSDQRLYQKELFSVGQFARVSAYYFGNA